MHAIYVCAGQCNCSIRRPIHIREMQLNLSIALGSEHQL